MNRNITDGNSGDYVSLNGDDDEQDMGASLDLSPPERPWAWSKTETHEMLILWFVPLRLPPVQAP